MPIQLIDLYPGLLGYSGAPGTIWEELLPQPDSGLAPDWYGYYLSPSPIEAEGYAIPGDDPSGNGPGTIWRIDLQEAIEAAVYTLPEGIVKVDAAAVRADLVAAGLNPGSQPLVEALGAAGYAYVGPSSPGQLEIAMSDILFTSSCLPPQAVATREYVGHKGGDWATPDGQPLKLNDLPAGQPAE